MSSKNESSWFFDPEVGVQYRVVCNDDRTALFAAAYLSDMPAKTDIRICGGERIAPNIIPSYMADLMRDQTARGGGSEWQIEIEITASIWTSNLVQLGIVADILKKLPPGEVVASRGDYADGRIGEAYMGLDGLCECVPADVAEILKSITTEV